MTSWGFLCQKHRPKTFSTQAAFAWDVVGVFVGAVVAALAERTPAPLRSAVAGVRAVRTDSAGSTF